MTYETNTFEWFCTMVNARLVTCPNERRGQAAFNALYQVRPDLSEQVRGGGLDPFYRDDRLPAFENFVKENW